MADSSKFDGWANQFKSAAARVASASTNLIGEAQDLLEGKIPPAAGAPSVESAAALVLGGLTRDIEDMMHNFDKMQQALGFGPRYSVFFALGKASPEDCQSVWSILRKYLSEY